jgi:hypothetical protein
MATVLCLTITAVPSVFGQISAINIVSYNYHVTSDGNPVVVGEIQNTGTNIIDTVYLAGTLYASNGTAVGICSGYAYGDHILPQQKAPFYLAAQTTTADMSWIQSGVDHINFVVAQANATDSYQYHDLVIRGNMASVTDNYYTVVGVVQNIGNLTTENDTWVVATFYNANGKVVTVGFSNPLATSPLTPLAFDSFTVLAFDSTISSIKEQITNYSLTVQTNGPIISNNATPTPTPSPSLTATATSSATPTQSASPTETASQNPTETPPPSDSITIPASLFYGVIIAVVLISVVVTAVVLRRRKTVNPSKPAA